MDGAAGTSRRAVATKPHTRLMNALIWLPARRTSGGTAAYRELAQTPRRAARPAASEGETNLTHQKEKRTKTKTPRSPQVSDEPEEEKRLLFESTSDGQWCVITGGRLNVGFQAKQLSPTT